MMTKMFDINDRLPSEPKMHKDIYISMEMLVQYCDDYNYDNGYRCPEQPPEGYEVCQYVIERVMKNYLGRDVEWEEVDSFIDTIDNGFGPATEVY